MAAVDVQTQTLLASAALVAAYAYMVSTCPHQKTVQKSRPLPNVPIDLYVGTSQLGGMYSSGSNVVYSDLNRALFGPTNIPTRQSKHYLQTF